MNALLRQYQTCQWLKIVGTLWKLRIFSCCTAEYISVSPLLRGRGHLKSTWNSHFYCCQPVLNGHLQLNFTTQHADTGNAKDCHPQIFIFYRKKRDLKSFTVQLCFLFQFVCIELVSLIWFLQIWVAIYVYGTLINWST